MRRLLHVLPPFTPSVLAIVLLGLALACMPEGEPGDANGSAEGAVPAPAAAREPAPEVMPPKIIILLSLDTLRPDHLGFYGYERFTSPTLDMLAAEGVVFDDASATAPWTLPSHASMLTGLYPIAHGAVSKHTRMNDATPTLASELARAGYTSAAVVNSTWLKPDVHGVTREFEKFLWVEEEPDRWRPSTWVTDQALEWLHDRRPDERLFLFMHNYDLHSDYASQPAYEKLFVGDYSGQADGTGEQLLMANASPEFVEYRRRLCKQAGDECPKTWLLDPVRLDARDIAHLRDLYDAQIRQLDAELARFFQFLRDEELMDQTLLIVTSDHGEEFGEHGGTEHTRTQYHEVIRVPLLIRGPGIPAGMRIAAPVSLVDLAPTILGLAGLRPSNPLDGRDLAPLWNGGDGRAFRERFQYHEAGMGGAGIGFVVELRDVSPATRAVRQGSFKLYYDSRESETPLYDLASDPGETRDVSAEQTEVARRLRSELDARYRELPDFQRNRIELDPQEAERLRALGYTE